ncbi:DUF4260 family protein [Dokdonia sinensis]|uniref:DUF4260 family protein n=1 Tax=Dokdonia sinensis TaxID=2479847 RepID=A0A3M0G9E0_9FLAO|nr:DUF4260 domain-containing protein [Dokdonia sinensis]RMB59072.1 DUF4260 family protein [Dokdonia sinensis]
MKKVLKLEEVAQFIFGIYLFSLLDFEWWWFLILILSPDIGMIGYILGNRVGAWSYNIFHHKGIAILVYLGGVYLQLEWLQLVGIILFAHASLDRMLGYGLKYEKGFKFTHLGNL